MHVTLTKPDYQQYLMTSSALGSPNFIKGKRYWNWLSNNKKYSKAGIKNTSSYLFFSFSGLSCCIHVDSLKIIVKTTMYQMRDWDSLLENLLFLKTF